MSFYTNDVNTQYEVYIYTNPTSGPIGGTQHVGPTGTMPMAGYHTVKLASPVPLSAGQRFSVVVKFTTSGYNYPVAVEYAVSGYSSGATASPGQSYFSPDGSAWQDTTTIDSTMNICIKAFTSSSGWKFLGGSTASTPAIASYNGEFYMVIRGTDNGIYYQKTTGGVWPSTWQAIPGATIDAPALAVLDNNLHLVIRGTDNGIYHNKMDLTTGTWSGWSSIPGCNFIPAKPGDFIWHSAFDHSRYR